MKNYFREDVAVEDINNVVKELIGILKLRKNIQDPSKIETSIYFVVANLVFHKDCEDKEILIQHFSKRYKVSPHRSFYTELRVIKKLEEFGFVEIYRAKSNKAIKELKDAGEDVSMHQENGKNRLSSMSLTDKGKEYFAGVSASVELVTRRKKIKAFTKGKSRSKERYDYYPFQADELEMVGRYANFLTDYNYLMNYHVLQYIDYEIKKVVEFNNDSRIIFTGDTSNKIHNHTRRGGRFVSEVSYMWKQNRKSITIDGKRTVEIDYACSLPSIMFGKLGFNLSPLENDLYHVPGEQNCDYMRKLAKTIVVCMLGVTDEYTLELAIRKKFDGYNNGWLENGYPIQQFFPENFIFEDIKRVITSILKRYRKLCPKVDKILFKADLATNILQGIEARIAKRIMNKFVQMGKPILCIHDSFRVLEEDEELLHKLMEKTYLNKVKMNPLGLKVDRQPQQEQQQEQQENVEEYNDFIEDNYDWSFINDDDSELFDHPEWTAFIEEDTVDLDPVEFTWEGQKFKHENGLDYIYGQDINGSDEWFCQGTARVYELYIQSLQCLHVQDVAVVEASSLEIRDNLYP
jgi:hypothetical protein